MADTKISELPAATDLTGTESLPVVQDGSTLRASVDLLRSPTVIETTAGAFTGSPAFTFPSDQLGQKAMVHTGVTKIFVLRIVPDSWEAVDIYVDVQPAGTGTAVFSYQVNGSDPSVPVEFDASAFAFGSIGPIEGEIAESGDVRAVLFGLIRGVPLVPGDESAEADFEISGDDDLAATVLVNRLRFVRTA